jgi:hypothetical protein
MKAASITDLQVSGAEDRQPWDPWCNVIGLLESLVSTGLRSHTAEVSVGN